MFGEKECSWEKLDLSREILDAKMQFEVSVLVGWCEFLWVEGSFGRLSDLKKI
jgi:hypothetical protein